MFTHNDWVSGIRYVRIGVREIIHRGVTYRVGPTEFRDRLVGKRPWLRGNR